MNPLKRSNNSSASSSNNSSPSSSSSSSSWIHLRSVLFVVTSSSPASCSSSDRGRLKSPWSRRKRKRVLSPQQWKNLFTHDGKIRDGGLKFLKRVRSGGVDPSIRAEVWPFLLGVYDLDTTKEKRDAIRTQNRKKYEKLRRQCRQLLNSNSGSFKFVEIGEISYEGDGVSLVQDSGSPSSEDAASARESLSSGEQSPDFEYSDDPSISLLEGDDAPNSSYADASALDSDSTDSDSSESPGVIQTFPSDDALEENNAETTSKENSSPSQINDTSKLRSSEDFATWQRIIRLDAVRANAEWMPFSPSQAVVHESRAHRSAEAVGLKDYGHLDAGRIFHAARLVAILEAYALYDPEIGYCQGMSDLLSPIISVISEDHEAFWCFVGFMKKARQNFRLDEVGIRRQLDIVAKIIKFKDSHLFRHLQKLQAEDCFFVYRMVVVLFRRELTFEQTMKALLLFAIFAVISQAYVIPSWTIYNTYAGYFKPTAVLASGNAIVNQILDLNVCGTANSNTQVNNFSYQVGQGSVVWSSGVINVPPQFVFSGASYCFDYTFIVPITAKPSFVVYLTLNNDNNGLATVQVNLNA